MWERELEAANRGRPVNCHGISGVLGLWDQHAPEPVTGAETHDTKAHPK